MEAPTLTSIQLHYDNGDTLNIKLNEIELVSAESEGKPFAALVARKNIVIAGFSGTFTAVEAE